MSHVPTEAILTAVERHAQVVLALYGSRARGDEHAASDGDFGYLADRSIDPLPLAASLRDAVGSDDVDVADLSAASALLRNAVARDGVLLYEASPGRFDEERVRWVVHWLDVEPVVREAHEAVLARLSYHGLALALVRATAEAGPADLRACLAAFARLTTAPRGRPGS